MKKVTVIGSGSWGTALAVMLAEHGHEVTIWSRRQEAVDELVERRANERYLPGVKIPAEIGATTDRAEAVAAAEIVILAVPSRAVRQTAKDFAPYFKKEQILVNVAKGLEEGSLLRLSEVNRADYFELLRVPGIGPKSAGRIVGARRSAVLGFDDLKKLGVVLKRALYFITCSGRMLYPTKIEEDYIVKHLVDALPGKLSEHHDPVTYRQMSLFDVGGLLDPGTGEGICC